MAHHLTHPSGLFTYAETSTNKQGMHFTGGVLLQDVPNHGKKGMRVDWITELGGLLIGWSGSKVIFDCMLPAKVHPCFHESTYAGGGKAEGLFVQRQHITLPSADA